MEEIAQKLDAAAAQFRELLPEFFAEAARRGVDVQRTRNGTDAAARWTLRPLGEGIESLPAPRPEPVYRRGFAAIGADLLEGRDLDAEAEIEGRKIARGQL